ncbi:MAG: glycerate kinase [Verrucomicrobia bacterium]|nr:MAG: glycerate kinase [Verrucomicrobiota bacterium]
MRILIAPDKFKGSLSAREVAENIEAGFRKVLPDAAIDIVPMADGGEGTAEVISHALGGSWLKCQAHDALDCRIEARYAFIESKKLAVMEMSEAAGLRRLTSGVRDPLRANTFGVGEILLDATRHGAQQGIIGLGGSATNDGGFGMARSLGFKFFANQIELTNGPAKLTGLTKISRPENLHLPRICAAVDVRNPLLGERGATRVFGPQKGARSEQIVILEQALTKLADVVACEIGCEFRNTPGAGAAGGLGFGLMSFGGAELRSGFELVAEILQLEQKVSQADFVVTGEGRLDGQTLEGKTPAGVAQIARKHGKPICAIVGRADRKIDYGQLFDAIYELARPPVNEVEAIKVAPQLLRERAEEAALSFRDSKVGMAGTN